MPQREQLAAPRVRGGAGLEDEMGSGGFNRETLEVSAGESVSLEDPTPVIGDRNLEDGLCEIDGDCRRMHEDSSVRSGPLRPTCYWHYYYAAHREEFIPSQAAGRARLLRRLPPA